MVRRVSAPTGAGSTRRRRRLPARFAWPLVLAFIASPAAAQQTGTVTGQVVASVTQTALGSVQVYVVGTGLGTLTTANGRYILLNVPAGTYEVRAERIGYATGSQQVTVQAGQSTQANFELSETALGLDEIVVTGTAGAARRREVGNSIAQINAVDIAEPVVDMEAMLQGRTSGLTVTQTGGAVGTGARIRLRGNVSATLSNQPLIYVDGVRIRSEGYPKNVPPTGYEGRSSNVVASPLNDINPNDIERVEIIKGAAATTLYGTEAAAGVIQIFTKRGHRGGARWTAQIDQALMDMQNFGPKYGLRGEDLVIPPGEDDPKQMFMEPFFRTGWRQNYVLSVAGGGEDLQYFLSGGFEGVDGVLELDRSDKYSVRGNFTFSPLDGLTLQWNNSYTRNEMTQTPNGGNAQGIHLNAQRRSQNYFNNGDPEVIKQLYEYEMNNDIDHFVTGFTATYAPTSSFTNRLTVGYDLAQQEARQLRPFGFYFARNGILSNQRWSNTTLTFDYVGSLNFRLGEDLGSTFSWGGQSVTTEELSVHGEAQNFPGPGDPTLSSGAIKLSFEDRIRIVNAGFFFQNVFDLKDRYFLTMGLRVDGNSAFGEDLGLEVYPKASFSYVISDEDFWNESMGQLKLRAAWGQSGRAPGAFDAVRTWDPIGWGGQPAFLPLNVGNPALGPEKTTELEIGADGSFLDDRLRAEFSYYTQKTTDALFNVRQIPSAGYTGSQLENVGEIKNTGIELSLDASIIRSENWSWDLGGALYTNNSEALDLGGAPSFEIGVRGWVVEGEPVPLVRGNCITNPDAVADPVIEANCAYGPNIPDLGFQVRTDVGLPGSMTLSARGEYQGGAWAYSNFEGEAYSRGIRWPTCFNAYPLIEQGRENELTAAERARCITANANRDYGILPTDFFKIREVTLQAPIPWQLPGASSATLTLSGRNLWTWKKKEIFGEDPEAAGGWLLGQTGNEGNIMILGGTVPPAVYSLSLRVVF